MEELDYWRLCDELNIVQAALLIVGEDPSMSEHTEDWEVHKRPKGYEAAKTAISHALVKYAKYLEEIDLVSMNVHGEPPYAPDPEYVESLRTRSLRGKLVPQLDTDMNGNTGPPIDGSIDLYKSIIEVASLKIWLRDRGISTGFFFAESGDTPEYLNPDNPRYAPKLAAAVKAWLSVTDPGNKSPKQALDKWLREHAARFGLADDEGLPINQAVEDCSKVANWKQSGGAPKTPG